MKQTRISVFTLVGILFVSTVSLYAYHSVQPKAGLAFSNQIVVHLKSTLPGSSQITDIAKAVRGQVFSSYDASTTGYGIVLPWARTASDTEDAVKTVLSYPEVDWAEVNSMAYPIDLRP